MQTYGSGILAEWPEWVVYHVLEKWNIRETCWPSQCEKPRYRTPHENPGSPEAHSATIGK
jgi:hypothetical protein